VLASPVGPQGSDPDDAAPSERVEVLVVELRGRAYALPAGLVREVAPAAPVTPLPGTADWVLGIAAVRGAPLPVADLQRRVPPRAGAEPGAPHLAAGGARDGWMVVVDDGRRSAALVGLRVRGVAIAHAVDEGPHVDGAQHDAPPHAGGVIDGLPVRGAVRLVDEGRRHAGAGPVRLTRQARARAATRAPTLDAPTPSALACLDVSALLDDLIDPGG
jgi:chemotaxis signal transduction protein